MDPNDKLHNAISRRMRMLGIAEEEARATVAFLKWMNAINTLGFPGDFKANDLGRPRRPVEPSDDAHYNHLHREVLAFFYQRRRKVEDFSAARKSRGRAVEGSMRPSARAV